MKHFHPAFLVLLLFFFSCNNSAESTVGNVDTPPVTNGNKEVQLTEADKIAAANYYKLQNALNRDSAKNTSRERLGQEVDLFLAQGCINEFEPKMNRHGFDRRGGRVNVRVTTSQKITNSEEFAGVELLQWMNKMIDSLSITNPKGQDVHFEMRMGIYNNAFFTRHVPRSSERDSLRDRITIFIIPFSDSVAYYNKAKAAGKITAYELGNLKP